MSLLSILRKIGVILSRIQIDFLLEIEVLDNKFHLVMYEQRKRGGVWLCLCVKKFFFEWNIFVLVKLMIKGEQL